jgi:hypothetical protein
VLPTTACRPAGPPRPPAAAPPERDIMPQTRHRSLEIVRRCIREGELFHKGNAARFHIELPRRLIKLYSYRDDLVGDVFLGRGTTALACVELGRRFRGGDRSPICVHCRGPGRRGARSGPGRMTQASADEHPGQRRRAKPVRRSPVMRRSATSTDVLGTTPLSAAIEILVSYSHRDEKLRKVLETHLSLLRRQGYIRVWHDRKIGAGTEWTKQISAHLESADLILLLVSPDFLASDYCYDIELRRALARHEAGTARVIPIILRPVDWHEAPFGKLQALPKDGKPISTWPNRDEAFKSVVEGVRLVVRALSSGRKRKLDRQTSSGVPTPSAPKPTPPTAARSSTAAVPVSRTKSRSKPKTEAEWVASMSQITRAVYERVRARVQKFGTDVKIDANASYIKFMVGGRNFADLTPRLAHVTTCVHPEGHKLRPGEHGIESGLGLSRARETAGWTLAICFDIAADTNMDAAERVLRQSYDVIKRQQTMTASKSAGGRRRPARSTGRSTRSVPPSRPI